MKQLRQYQMDAVNQCWTALKLNDEPVLLMASVGAGKSIMIASILLSMEKAGKRALCIVNNAELVRNNCETFREQGGSSSIYCAALGEKNPNSPVVFGTSQSVLNSIKKNEELSKIRFNIIVVDEAHCINFKNSKSTFMRILRYYKQEYHDMRLLGATGTNFRFKGTPIVGEDCLFKKQVGDITTEWLIENDYLVEPTFQIDKNLVLDFSRVKIKKNGQFDQRQLEMVVDQSARLTQLICQQIVHIMETQKRFGIFIFATTRKHAEEIMSHLPMFESALILGDTPQEERTRVLNEARKGIIRYLVNISIVSVGVDVPPYDTLAYLRPSESMVFIVQTLGRSLRLSPNTNKKDALILDFAGNIERHSDWDNPILLQAVKKSLDKNKPLVIGCPCCGEMNTETARRCVGMIDKKNEKINKKTGEIQQERCSYYFEFKECENMVNGTECGAKNDLVARECHACKCELIDPNAKLSMAVVQQNVKEVEVIETKFGISGTQKGFRINCAYRCKDSEGRTGSVYEHYSPVSDKAMRMFYGQFVRRHLEESSNWYPHLQNRDKIEEMLREANVPTRLLIAKEKEGIRIKKKIF